MRLRRNKLINLCAEWHLLKLQLNDSYDKSLVHFVGCSSYVQVSESAFFDSDTLYDGLLEGIRVSEALTPTPGSQLAKRFTS